MISGSLSYFIKVFRSLVGFVSKYTRIRNCLQYLPSQVNVLRAQNIPLRAEETQTRKYLYLALTCPQKLYKGHEL